MKTEVKFLPFNKAWIGEEEKKEMMDTLESGWLTKGPKTIAFQKQFAEFVGVPHAIGTNSCTAALHLSLVALEIGEGDEVITSPITFAATANVIEHVGAKPVFVDVDPETLNMNPRLIEAAITSKTKAIIPVHFAGQMCQMDLISEVAKRHQLKIIEDAAHALEANYQGKAPGSWGDMAAFSFYPTKNITTGEGGMVVTHDSNLAERVEILSLHGLSRHAWKRYSDESYQHWEILEAGFKCHMSDLEASLGIPQLKKIQQFWERRQQIVTRYDEAFNPLSGIRTLRNLGKGKHAHHLYVIRLDPNRLTISRDRFLALLQKEGIGVGVHFRAVHLHPYYQNKYQIAPGTFPIAEQISEEIVSLPLYPLMSDQDVSNVISAVTKILSNSSR